MGFSRDSRFLYTLDNNIQSITGFQVDGNGRLVAAGAIAGLPASAVGLAAR